MLNVTCEPGLWARHRKVARTSPALLVRGILEKADGVINLRADRLTALTVPVRPTSRDFRWHPARLRELVLGGPDQLGAEAVAWSMHAGIVHVFANGSDAGG
jgi:hypothetical protein